MQVLITDSLLSGIANSIREKRETTALITPAEMASEIDKIPNIGYKSASGSFMGDGLSYARIQCDFSPDIITISGDLSGDVSYRGIRNIVIVRNILALIQYDSSTTAYSALTNTALDITNYNEDSTAVQSVFASYENGTLKVDNNASAQPYGKFLRGITYSYTLLKYQPE